MNPDLNRLQPYPFQRIATLKAGLEPPSDKALISLAIGEPKHPLPSFIKDAVAKHLSNYESYPLTAGTKALREAISAWLTRRFHLPEDSLNESAHVLPVNGTREALFAFAQCVIDRSQQAVVVMPNPFYQIYEGAALLAGAEPHFMNCTVDNQFLPDLEAVPDKVWQRCQLAYICSPGNPTGAVMPEAQLRQLLDLAERYDFIIASDECYSELYFDEENPPPGLLEVAAKYGNDQYKRCVVFNSLSKRSNAAGLRSGFVAGDAEIIRKFHLYRTYHGSAMPLPSQKASIAAWSDETHVRENRALYQEKFRHIIALLTPFMNVSMPDASFYLWPELPLDDERFTQRIFTEQHINVIPGSYLSRDAEGINPGRNRVRMALVAPLAECVEAVERLKDFYARL